MNKAVLTFGVFFLLFSSCSFLRPEEVQETPIVRVNDQFLSAEELSSVIPENISSQDSIMLVRGYIDRWIEKQLMIEQAEINLTRDLKSIEKQVEEYRNDLLIYAYQNQMVNQRLDTNLTEQELLNYYNEHKDNFELKDYLVRVVYVKLDTNAPQLDEVREWLESDSEKDFIELEDYCYQFAVNFYLEENKWLYLDELLREIPIEGYEKRKLLNNKKIVDFSDGTYLYLIRFLDHKLKDSISPFELEKENIRGIIINQRKLDFINKLKKNLYDEALRKGKFEIFDK